MVLFSVISLALTPYGWGGIVALVIGLLLTYMIGQRRVSEGKGNLGCLGFGYVFLVITILMTFALSITWGIGSSIYKTITIVSNGQRYEAKITSFSSYESYDSDTGNYTTMYTPTVSFVTSSDEKVTHTLSYASSSRPDIGNSMVVYYNPILKDSVSFGFGTWALFIGALIMATVFLFAFWGVLLYAMNYKMDKYFTKLKFIGIHFFIPFIMILFDGLLLYALLYGNEVPIYVSGILVFFILVLTLGIWGYIKMIRSSDIVWTKTGPGKWGGHAVPKMPKKNSWIKRN